MTPEEIEALAQQVAAIIAASAPAVAVESTIEATVETVDVIEAELVTCACGGHVEPIAAAAVARTDAPVSISPEDGLDPEPLWESRIREIESRLSATEDRINAVESDMATILVESTDKMFVG